MFVTGQPGGAALRWEYVYMCTHVYACVLTYAHAHSVQVCRPQALIVGVHVNMHVCMCMVGGGIRASVLPIRVSANSSFVCEWRGLGDVSVHPRLWCVCVCVCVWNYRIHSTGNTCAV